MDNEKDIDLIIQPLNEYHNCDRFDSGEDAINSYIKSEALSCSEKNLSKTYVLVSKLNTDVLGYFTLCYSELSVEADKQFIIGDKDYTHNIPIMKLARLGLDKSLRGKGYAEELIEVINHRTFDAAKIAGISSLVVDAKNQQLVKKVYKKYGFKRFDHKPLQLYITIDEIIDKIKVE